MPIILGIISLLSLILITSVWSTSRRRQAATELRRSNARVLREYKSIALHRPNHIIRTEPTRRTNGVQRNPDSED